MIHYVVSASHRGGIDSFLATRGRSLAAFVRPVTWDRLFSMGSVPAGTYVFTDADRRGAVGASRAAHIWSALEAAGPGVRLLNHPIRARLRYELLRHLRERGWNAFDVYRATEARLPQRYPVFLRGEYDHKGHRSEPLHGPEQLVGAVESFERQGRSRETLLIVEFCDTSDERGLYRKYSSFYVAGRVVPRHLFFSRDWMIKTPGPPPEPDRLEEEWRYVRENPHEKQVREAFEVARIDYGRIDYAMLDGRMQVWEINTNPYVTTPRDGGGPERRRVAEHFTRAFEAAMREIDSPLDPRERIRIPATRGSRRGLGGWAARALGWPRWRRRRRRGDPGVRPEGRL